MNTQVTCEKTAALEIRAMADGQIIDVTGVCDPIFSHQSLGRTIAFWHAGEQVTLCSPVSGRITAVFPGGEAFTLRTDHGVELLIHIGIHTSAAEGNGFERYHIKPGDSVKCGDEIVTVNYEKLSRQYDMTTFLVITDAQDLAFDFRSEGPVKRGQSLAG